MPVTRGKDDRRASATDIVPVISGAAVEHAASRQGIAPGTAGKVSGSGKVIVAEATRQVVPSPVIVQRVVTRLAEEQIVALAAFDFVAPGAGMDEVVTIAAGDHVRSAAAGDHVGGGASRDRRAVIGGEVGDGHHRTVVALDTVDARTGGEIERAGTVIHTGLRPPQIVALGNNHVFGAQAGAENDAVGAFGIGDLVEAAVGLNHVGVVARAALQAVVRCHMETIAVLVIGILVVTIVDSRSATGQCIVAGIAKQPIGADTAVEHVVAAAALDPVAASQAIDHVVPTRTINRLSGFRRRGENESPLDLVHIPFAAVGEDKALDALTVGGQPLEAAQHAQLVGGIHKVEDQRATLAAHDERVGLQAGAEEHAVRLPGVGAAVTYRQAPVALAEDVAIAATAATDEIVAAQAVDDLGS